VLLRRKEREPEENANTQNADGQSGRDRRS
jgi:hypothetical protein